jgi:trans-aconitate methyltransferase
MTTQVWSAESYAHNARFVADLGAPLLALLNPQADEDILDLGCGDGALTLQIAQSGARVIGVDGSSSMVAAAVASGVDARVMNGEALDFRWQFDAVFSNAALHWMLRPDAVLAGVARALKPGGRFIAEFGGHGNVAAIVVALLAVVRRLDETKAVRSPWYFPTADEYEHKLKQHGFVVDQIALIPRPTLLATGMEAWLKVFAQSFLSHLSQADQEIVRAEAVDLLRPALCDGSGNWIADYVRLRFSARLA